MNTKTATILLASLLAFLTCAPIVKVHAWGNGGYSNDPANPEYGTHDWIAEHALNMLPAEERAVIASDEALLHAFLLGTELPDNSNKSIGGINDKTKHHVYFYADGSVQEDDAATRAQEEYAEAVANYTAGNWYNASKTLGIMAHYIADVAVFGHVMGADTDWGTETHHSDYEDYVGSRTGEAGGEFDAYLVYDGASSVSAYDATLMVANDTTFDFNGDLNCTWMDTNYDWSDTTFKDRCGESLNMATNTIADVLHTFFLIVPEFPPSLIAPIFAVVTLVAVVCLRKKKAQQA